jgi:hypothetical protein
MPKWIGGYAGTGPVVGDLCKGTDVFGDGTAPESADWRKHPVVIGSEGCSRRGQRRLRVSEPRDRHHRDRRHPRLVRVVLDRIRRLPKVAQLVRRTPIVVSRRKWCRTKFAAAGGVAEQLEPTPVRSERRKIGVACPTGLAGLAGETRQRLRRRRDARACKAREKTGPDYAKPELPRFKSKLTAVASHHWSSKLAYVHNNGESCANRTRISD